MSDRKKNTRCTCDEVALNCTNDQVYQRPRDIAPTLFCTPNTCFFIHRILVFGVIIVVVMGLFINVSLLCIYECYPAIIQLFVQSITIFYSKLLIFLKTLYKVFGYK